MLNSQLAGIPFRLDIFCNVICDTPFTFNLLLNSDKFHLNSSIIFTSLGYQIFMFGVIWEHTEISKDTKGNEQGLRMKNSEHVYKATMSTKELWCSFLSLLINSLRFLLSEALLLRMLYFTNLKPIVVCMVPPHIISSQWSFQIG